MGNYNSDQKNARFYGLKLSRNTDGELIDHLGKQSNIQAYLKNLIRNDMMKGETNVSNWDYIVSLMDDEIREAVHADMAPCTEDEFLDEYKKRHQEKYGEEFKY